MDTLWERLESQYQDKWNDTGEPIVERSSCVFLWVVLVAGGATLEFKGSKRLLDKDEGKLCTKVEVRIRSRCYGLLEVPFRSCVLVYKTITDNMNLEFGLL
ncbi:hypothetical protein GQ53DRAFT_825487 [Thozetella sp. PMI_491]|nr:hypothetical protein GQ53DRAFT_825487 [Thozetella sp. PMI_491]